MSEWITTGQMIDRLKVGELAESNERADLRVKNTAIGILYVNDEGERDKRKGIDGYFFVNGSYIKNMKWRILPNYVSFEEAMKAHKEKKTVTYHDEELKYTFEYGLDPQQFEQLYYDSISLHELVEGKWTIEADTQ